MSSLESNAKAVPGNHHFVFTVSLGIQTLDEIDKDSFELRSAVTSPYKIEVGFLEPAPAPNYLSMMISF